MDKETRFEFYARQMRETREQIEVKRKERDDLIGWHSVQLISLGLRNEQGEMSSAEVQRQVVEIERQASAKRAQAARLSKEIERLEAELDRFERALQLALGSESEGGRR